MFEFKKISGNIRLGVIVDKSVFKCTTCSPLLVGQQAVLFLEIEGKEHFVKTSVIVEVQHPRPRLAIIKTKSGSTYEIKEI